MLHRLGREQENEQNVLILFIVRAIILWPSLDALAGESDALLSPFGNALLHCLGAVAKLTQLLLPPVAFFQDVGDGEGSQGNCWDAGACVK